MKTFEEHLHELARDEIYRLNDEASEDDCSTMTEDLENDARRALARLAIRLAKESPDD